MEPFSMHIIRPFYWSERQGGPDHIDVRCPAGGRIKDVYSVERGSSFYLPDPNGDVCGTCERMAISSGECEPTSDDIREALGGGVV